MFMAILEICKTAYNLELCAVLMWPRDTAALVLPHFAPVGAFLTNMTNRKYKCVFLEYNLGEKMKRFEYCQRKITTCISDDELNKIGNDGWELAGCGTLWDGNHHILYFKKEKV